MKLKEFMIYVLKCHITQEPNHITEVVLTEKHTPDNYCFMEVKQVLWLPTRLLESL